MLAQVPAVGQLVGATLASQGIGAVTLEVMDVIPGPVGLPDLSAAVRVHPDLVALGVGVLDGEIDFGQRCYYL